MKTFLAATLFLASATAFALGGCASDDNATTETTAIGNTANGGVCTQGAECQSGVCGYAIAKACKATGVCMAQTSCAVRTQCPCGGGPAFSECDDGVHAGQAVTGDLSCAVLDGGLVVDSSVPGSDASDSGDATNDGSVEAGDGSVDASDASNDSGDAADGHD